MQLELSPEVESVLHAEASTLGLTPEENHRRILAEHARRLLASGIQEDKNVRIRTVDEALAWIRSRNPQLHETDERTIEWRKMAHEGHKY